MCWRLLLVSSFAITGCAVRQMALDVTQQKQIQSGTEDGRSVVSEGAPTDADVGAFLDDDAMAEMIQSFKTADADHDSVVSLKDLKKLDALAADAESYLLTYGSLVKKPSEDVNDPAVIGFSFPDFVSMVYKGPINEYSTIKAAAPSEGVLTVGKVIAWLQQKCATTGSSYDYATDVLKTTYGYRSATWNAESSEVMDVKTFEEIYHKSEWVHLFSKFSSGDNGELTYDDFEKALVAIDAVEEAGGVTGLEGFEGKIGKAGRMILGGVFGIKSEESKRRAEIKDQMKIMGRKIGESGEKVVKFTAFINFQYDRNANLAKSKMWTYTKIAPEYDRSKWYRGRRL